MATNLNDKSTPMWDSNQLGYPNRVLTQSPDGAVNGEEEMKMADIEDDKSTPMRGLNPNAKEFVPFTAEEASAFADSFGERALLKGIAQQDVVDEDSEGESVWDFSLDSDLQCNESSLWESNPTKVRKYLDEYTTEFMRRFKDNVPWDRYERKMYKLCIDFGVPIYYLDGYLRTVRNHGTIVRPYREKTHYDLPSSTGKMRKLGAPGRHSKEYYAPPMSTVVGIPKGNFFVIPRVENATRVDKPTSKNFSVGKFRSWCVYVGSQLPVPKDKRFVLTGNFECERLYYNYKSSPDLSGDLANVRIYWTDATYQPKKPTGFTVKDFMPMRDFYTCGPIYLTRVEHIGLLPERVVFKNRPTFKALYFLLKEKNFADDRMDAHLLKAWQSFPYIDATKTKDIGDWVTKLIPPVNQGFPEEEEKADIPSPRELSIIPPLVDVPRGDTLPELDFEDTFGDSTSAEFFQEKLMKMYHSIGVVQKDTSFDWFSRILHVLNMCSLIMKAKTMVERAQILMLYIQPQISDFVDVAAFRAGVRAATMQGVSESPLWGIIFDTFGYLSVTAVMGVLFTGESLTTVVQTCVRRLGGSLRYEIGSSLKDRVMESFHRVLSLFKECATARSLKPLLSDELSIARWTRETRAVLFFKTNLYYNDAFDLKEFTMLQDKRLIPSDWTHPFTPESFSEVVQLLVVRGKRIIAFYDTISVRNTMTPLVADLEGLIASMVGHASSNSFREAPFGFYVQGVPGQGKTMLLDTIFKSLGRLNNLPVESHNSFYYDVSTNFADGLSTQWAIFMDDQDQKIGNNTGKMSWAEVVIALVNNKPYHPDQAAIEKKGAISARPLLFGFASNYVNPTKDMIKEPIAIWRRFSYYLKVTAKPEYCVNGILNSDLVGTNVDMYIIQVYQFNCNKHDAANPYESFPYELVETFTELPRFLMFFNDKFRSHVRKERELLARRTQDFCPQCGMSTSSRCGCPAMQGYSDVIVAVGLTCLVMWIVHTSRVKIREWIALATMLYHRARLEWLVRFRQAHALLAHMERVSLLADDWLARIYKARYFVIAFIGGPIVWMCLKTYARNLFKNQGRNGNAIEGFIPENWVRLNQDFTPGIPRTATSTDPEAIVKAIRASLVVVHATGSGTAYTYGLIVGPDSVLVPKHLVSHTGVASELRVHVPGVNSENPIIHKVKVDDLSVASLSMYDVAVVSVPGLQAIASVAPYLIEAAPTINFFDEGWIVYPDKILKFDNGPKVDINRLEIFMPGAGTVEGDCGLPYLMRSGKDWAICGIHSKLYESFDQSAGTMVSRSTIRPLLARINCQLQGVKIVDSQFGYIVNEGSFGQFPKKSEIYAAISQQGVEVRPLGKLELQITGSTLKSSVVETRIHKYFIEETTRVCGYYPYFGPASFKGAMEDGNWESPYTQCFKHYKRGNPDWTYLCLAFLDYISTFKDLSWDGIRILSDNEALTGVPNSVIGGTMLSSSMGPPFNRKKSSYYRIDYSNQGDPVGYMSPEASQIIEEFKSVLAVGDVPLCVVIDTLKDEVLKIGKSARVFNIFPHGFNFLTKKYTKPLLAQMRMYPETFESWVGIDMTGPNCIKVRAQMDKYNLEYCRSLDIKKLDKSTIGHILKLRELSVAYMAHLAGYSEADINLCRNLDQSNRLALEVCKNDVFQVGMTNHSGGDGTVEINSFSNSVAHRYAYYKYVLPVLPEDLIRSIESSMTHFTEHWTVKVPKKYFSFRERVGLATYGDDSLCSVTEPKLFPCSAMSVCSELNLTFTGPSKEEVASVDWVPFDKCSFLKRRVVYLDGVPVAPIEEKTLVKMATYRVVSKLNETEHLVEICDAICREAVYYGREGYDKWVGLLSHALTSEKLEHIYQFKPFDAWWAEVKANKFRTWKVGL